MKKPWDISEVAEVISFHYPRAQAIYLFGSHASGEAWPSSDVDLAILLPHLEAERAPPLALSDCAAALASTTHAEVDLVNLRTVGTILQKEIIHRGQRIWTQDKAAADAFEMQVLKAYQMLQKEREELVAEGLRGGRLYQP